MQTTELSKLTFSDAAPLWLIEHSRYIAPRTIHDYKQYIGAVGKFFATPDLKHTVLADIHIGHLRAYQDWRRKVSEANPRAAGPGRINMELSMLQQVLKEAHLWTAIEPLYRPLPVSRKGSGRSYTPEEEDLMLRTAFNGGAKWELAAHCLRIMLRLGCGFGELRFVRRRNLDLKSDIATITIERDEEYSEGAKNEKRERTIPLVGESLESATWLLERWKDLGGKTGSDFLIPSRRASQTAQMDFSKPITSIKTAVSAIQRKAGVKGRIYDCRVTCLTKAMKSGKVSLHTGEKLFGHVSKEIQKRYYKPELQVLMDAISVLDPSAQKRPVESACENPSKLQIVR